MSLEYWRQNQQRWASMLIVANDIAAMFSLPTVDEDAIRSLGGEKALPHMWWQGVGRVNTYYVGIRQKNKRFDVLGMREDRQHAFAITVGILHDRFLFEFPCVRTVLGAGQGTVWEAYERWRKESDDFRVMVQGLAGDMRSKALRHLVLGRTG